MKSLKNKLFEFRKDLTIDQDEVAKIVTELMSHCDNFSEREIYNAMFESLNPHKYFENVSTLLKDIDAELSANPLIYNLKDLYSKIKRKGNTFMYENALSVILECINQENDNERKVKILSELKLYDWIPEVKMMLFELSSTPQQKQNFSSEGGKIEDVYSIILQINDGYLAYVHDKWFHMTEKNITTTLLENHVQDITELRKYRLLEQVLHTAQISDEFIDFKVADELTVSVDTKNGKIFMNGHEADKETTLENLFNSPVIPAMAKAFYPMMNECINNLKSFVNFDAVKKVYNIVNTAYECYVFNFKGNMYQYRIDKYNGNTCWEFKNAMPLIENVMQELGADITFFYENQLSDEIKAKRELEKQEKRIMEKLEDIDNAILKIKEEHEIMQENAIKTVYNQLLANKHKLSEELKVVKNNKMNLLK